MNNELFENQGQGVLYVSGTRGYSAYEIAVQNGFVGTEQEWLDSLVGPQGEQGTPFDELTEEQKAEIKGDEGKSAYEIAVEHGFIGTEQDWVNAYLSPDGYYNKDEVDLLLTEKPYYFNTLNDMKEADLSVGSYATTFGYYSFNDGGSSNYIIVDDDSLIDNGGTIIELENGLKAILIVKDNTISVKQFGAYGDNTHDDTTAIQKTIDTGRNVVIPKDTYLLENSINIQNKGGDSSFYIFDAEDATFNYTGDDYAFIFTGVRNATIKFGYIKSTVGGNIKLNAPDSSTYIQYVTFYFKMLKCVSSDDSNVYAIQDTNGWINEIKWFGGRFIGSAGNNFHLYHNTPNNGMGGWSFYNIGFEGGTNCVKLESVVPENSSAGMYGFSFYGCRYAESFTKLIVATGTGSIRNLVFYSPVLPHINYLSFNDNCTNWRFFGGSKDSARVINGIYTENFINDALSGGSRIMTETNINTVLFPGNYIIGNYNIAGLCTNLPVSVPGRLIVESLTSTSTNPTTDAYQYVRQTYKTMNGNTFERNINISNGNTTIYDWRHLTSDEDNIYTFGLKPTEIPANSDLNDYTTPGNYFNGQAAQVSSMTNCPVTSAFDMRVFNFNNSNYYTCQELKTLDGRLFCRHCTTSAGFNGTTWTQKI